jgi:fructokinase
MPAAGHIAVIGEAVADAFPGPAAVPVPQVPGPRVPGPRGPVDALDLHVRPGGSPANTAVALGRLGTPTRFLGRLATGLLGGLLYDHLAASEVDLSGCVRATGTACLAIAAVDAEGRTSYDFYLDGATDWQWSATELVPDRVGAAAGVHAGSLGLVIRPGGPLVEGLLGTVRQHATVSIDPNVRPGIVPADGYRAGMDRWCRLADIVRMSDEDLAVLRPDGDFDRACAEWHAAGVRLVVLTRGPHGAVASFDGTRVEVPAVPVTIVDTVGAGDSFTAGLLHSLWRGGHLARRLSGTGADDVRQAMAFAVRVAAATCAVRGADPPWRDQLSAIA